MGLEISRIKVSTLYNLTFQPVASVLLSKTAWAYNVTSVRLYVFSQQAEEQGFMKRMTATLPKF
jgi:hypothetical protein